ncbi:MAG TPA: 4-(cytidine 5'-diphospho)-2-C-methyl-D-erythritol kinase [Bacteroidetes bacterium]|nr:4-(cytidine 5'-diphospho)-2-C-methyl-D-erythritol kinase [Bacteroidota bacterium]
MSEVGVWRMRSYAKINLGLHVLERLDNGYHQIETGMVYIDWWDQLNIRQAASFEFHVSDSTIPTDDQNLVVKAYRAFEDHVGLADGHHYAIDLMKQVPTGAGLGGGSANAAAVLLALNELEQSGCTKEDLIELSTSIGSDIAFFLGAQPAISSGQGHQLETLPIQPNAWIVVVNPGFESSTAEAYAQCEPNPEPILPLKTLLMEEPLEEWRLLLENDLEPAVIARHDMIGLLKDQLYEFGAIYASMSGSGSSVFGLFEQEFVAFHASDSLTKLGYKTNVTAPNFVPDTTLKAG